MGQYGMGLVMEGAVETRSESGCEVENTVSALREAAACF